jgi:light-regulated signal transduction histidine kinase (bacteriophytochrome)
MTDAISQTIDFSVCSAERIDAPGAIQKFGILAAVSRDSGRVTHSTDPHLLSGFDAKLSISGCTLVELCKALDLGADAVVSLEELRRQPHGQKTQAHEIAHGDGWAAYASSSFGHILVEKRIASSETVENAVDPNLWLDQLNETASTSDGNPFALGDSVTQMIRDLTGFDRVMVYRFAQDWSGEVIAEARADNMTPYLGLHYPATDIPAQARALYLENRIREIADTLGLPVTIMPPCAANSHAPLDMSTSVLRAISPYHLQYMANMGVRSTLVSSLLVDGKLWGLIACHSLKPKVVAPSVREAVRRASLIFEERISNYLDAQLARSRKSVTRSIFAVMETLRSEDEHICHLLDLISEVTRSDGAMVFFNGSVVASGRTPTMQSMRATAIKILKRFKTGYFASDSLGDFAASERTPETDFGHSAGIAGFVLPEMPEMMVAVFRNEYVREVEWGGDPTRAAQIDPDRGTLTPRKSFSAWCQIMRGRSEPWDSSVSSFFVELFAADRAATFANRISGKLEVVAGFSPFPSVLQSAVMNEGLDGIKLVVGCDESNTIHLVSYSRAFAKLFEFSPGRFRLKSLDELIEALKGSKSLSELSEVAEFEAWSPSKGLRYLSLEKRRVLDSFIDGRGRNWAVYVFRDITQLRRIETSFSVAFDQATEQARAKSAFLANMSHELRTPLNAVIGYSEAIELEIFGRLQPQKYKDYGSSILSAGQHLLSLVDRVLMTAQIDAKRRELHLEKVDLLGIARESVEWMKRQPKADEMTIAIAEPNKPIHIEGDSVALHQVLCNLIGNAVKFCPSGSRIEVEVGLDGSQSPKIVVKDNGPGIDPKFLTHIFEPFRQGEEVYSRHFGGVGLGLSIVKGLVELHGGDVRVASSLGAGAKFTVTLPRDCVRD